jgi:hypothetical protein
MQAILFEHLVQFRQLMARLAGHQMQMMHLCLPLVPLEVLCLVLMSQLSKELRIVMMLLPSLQAFRLQMFPAYQ